MDLSIDETNSLGRKMLTLLRGRFQTELDDSEWKWSRSSVKILVTSEFDSSADKSRMDQYTSSL